MRSMTRTVTRARQRSSPEIGGAHVLSHRPRRLAIWGISFRHAVGAPAASSDARDRASSAPSLRLARWRRSRACSCCGFDPRIGEASMSIAVAREVDAGRDPRRRDTPETVKKVARRSAPTVTVETGAGRQSGIPDADYEAAGATIVAERGRGARGRRHRARRCAARRRPSSPRYKPGALVVAIMDPYGHEAALQAMAEAGRHRLRHGVHAAHHPRAGDGRAVEPGQPRRLPGGDRRGRANMAAPCR